MMGSLTWQYKQESLNKQKNKDNKKVVKTFCGVLSGFPQNQCSDCWY